jgi:hypothetical protein
MPLKGSLSNLPRPVKLQAEPSQLFSSSSNNGPQKAIKISDIPSALEAFPIFLEELQTPLPKSQVTVSLGRIQNFLQEKSNKISGIVADLLRDPQLQGIENREAISNKVQDLMGGLNQLINATKASVALTDDINLLEGKITKKFKNI